MQKCPFPNLLSHLRYILLVTLSTGLQFILFSLVLLSPGLSSVLSAYMTPLLPEALLGEERGVQTDKQKAGEIPDMLLHLSEAPPAAAVGPGLNLDPPIW